MTSSRFGKVLCITLASVWAIPSQGNYPMLDMGNPKQPPQPKLSPEREREIAEAKDVLINTTQESRELYLGIMTDLINFGPDAEMIKATIFKPLPHGGYMFLPEHVAYLRKNHPDVRMHVFNMAKYTLDEIAGRFPKSAAFMSENYNIGIRYKFVFGQKSHVYPNAAEVSCSYADFKVGHRYLEKLAKQKPLLFLREPEGMGR